MPLTKKNAIVKINTKINENDNNIISTTGWLYKYKNEVYIITTASSCFSKTIQNPCYSIHAYFDNFNSTGISKVLKLEIIGVDATSDIAICRIMNGCDQLQPDKTKTLHFCRKYNSINYDDCLIITYGEDYTSQRSIYGNIINVNENESNMKCDFISCNLDIEKCIYGSPIMNSHNYVIGMMSASYIPYGKAVVGTYVGTSTSIMKNVVKKILSNTQCDTIKIDTKTYRSFRKADLGITYAYVTSEYLISKFSDICLKYADVSGLVVTAIEKTSIFNTQQSNTPIMVGDILIKIQKCNNKKKDNNKKYTILGNGIEKYSLNYATYQIDPNYDTFTELIFRRPINNFRVYTSRYKINQKYDDNDIKNYIKDLKINKDKMPVFFNSNDDISNNFSIKKITESLTSNNFILTTTVPTTNASIILFLSSQQNIMYARSYASADSLKLLLWTDGKIPQISTGVTEQIIEYIIVKYGINLYDASVGSIAHLVNNNYTDGSIFLEVIKKNTYGDFNSLYIDGSAVKYISYRENDKNPFYTICNSTIDSLTGNKIENPLFPYNFTGGYMLRSMSTYYGFISDITNNDIIGISKIDTDDYMTIFNDVKGENLFSRYYIIDKMRNLIIKMNNIDDYAFENNNNQYSDKIIVKFENLLNIITNPQLFWGVSGNKIWSTGKSGVLVKLDIVTFFIENNTSKDRYKFTDDDIQLFYAIKGLFLNLPTIEMNKMAKILNKYWSNYNSIDSIIQPNYTTWPEFVGCNGESSWVLTVHTAFLHEHLNTTLETKMNILRVIETFLTQTLQNNRNYYGGYFFSSYTLMMAYAKNVFTSSENMASLYGGLKHWKTIMQKYINSRLFDVDIYIKLDKLIYLAMKHIELHLYNIVLIEPKNVLGTSINSTECEIIETLMPSNLLEPVEIVLCTGIILPFENITGDFAKDAKIYNTEKDDVLLAPGYFGDLKIKLATDVCSWSISSFGPELLTGIIGNKWVQDMLLHNKINIDLHSIFYIPFNMIATILKICGVYASDSTILGVRYSNVISDPNLNASTLISGEWSYGVLAALKLVITFYNKLANPLITRNYLLSNVLPTIRNVFAAKSISYIGKFDIAFNITSSDGSLGIKDEIKFRNFETSLKIISRKIANLLTIKHDSILQYLKGPIMVDTLGRVMYANKRSQTGYYWNANKIASIASTSWANLVQNNYDPLHSLNKIEYELTGSYPTFFELDNGIVSFVDTDFPLKIKSFIPINDNTQQNNNSAIKIYFMTIFGIEENVLLWSPMQQKEFYSISFGTNVTDYCIYNITQIMQKNKTLFSFSEFIAIMDDYNSKTLNNALYVNYNNETDIVTATTIDINSMYPRIVFQTNYINIDNKRTLGENNWVLGLAYWSYVNTTNIQIKNDIMIYLTKFLNNLDKMHFVYGGYMYAPITLDGTIQPTSDDGQKYEYFLKASTENNLSLYGFLKLWLNCLGNTSESVNIQLNINNIKKAMNNIIGYLYNAIVINDVKTPYFYLAKGILYNNKGETSDYYSQATINKKNIKIGNSNITINTVDDDLTKLSIYDTNNVAQLLDIIEANNTVPYASLSLAADVNIMAINCLGIDLLNNLVYAKYENNSININKMRIPFYLWYSIRMQFGYLDINNRLNGIKFTNDNLNTNINYKNIISSDISIRALQALRKLKLYYSTLLNMNIKTNDIIDILQSNILNVINNDIIGIIEYIDSQMITTLNGETYSKAVYHANALMPTKYGRYGHTLPALSSTSLLLIYNSGLHIFENTVIPNLIIN